MRVLHIIKVTGIAGAEQHLITLLSGLRAKQVDARMILLVEPDNQMENYEAALTGKGIPTTTIIIRHHADLTLIPRIKTELERQAPDLIHTHLIHADLYGTLAARWAGVPIISSRHNDDAFRYRTPVKMVNQQFWKLITAGIGISDAITQFSIDVEGATQAQMHRIHYGMDSSIKGLDRGEAKKKLVIELNLPNNSTFVGMVCRLVAQKGVTYGLEAFCKIAREFPHTHLLVIGEGALRAELEIKAHQSGFADRIHFLGWRPEAARLMAGLDILLAPSLWEGFGLVLLEAMAQETAIIASRVSAIPEVVTDRETGILVAPRDVDGLAEGLRALLADPTLRQRMGMMGRDRLEHVFSAARMVDETFELYHTVIDGM